MYQRSGATLAADVTLIALPYSSENLRTAEYMTRTRLFDDDEVTRDDNGEIIAWTYTDRRAVFHRKVHDMADWHEVGPVSYLKAGLLGMDCFLPAPTVAVHRYWSTPGVVRPVDITQTMVCMSLANRSHYRGRHWRTRHGRPRQVRRWLTGRIGWIVWAEAW